MRASLLVILTAPLVLVAACGRRGLDGKSKTDHAALQGEWEVVSAESNGEPPPPGLLSGAKFTFSGEKLTLLGKEGTFELDTSKSPKQIDFIRGKTRQIGIYERDGDNLKLCVGPSDDRPKEFKTKPRTDHSLFVLRRPGAAADDLATARKGFATTLRVRGAAPQPYQNDRPPAGVKLVEFPSGDLKLKGWLSADANDGKKRPAVVYLHGGFAFGDGDWEDAEPFAKAGFVLFMSMLRGENGNPGNYESFFGEVDDAVAAGRFVASLPNVDGENVFVAGHSVGGVLTCLVAMLPSPYKAAAALDGYVAMENWAAGSPDALVPYDRTDPREVRVRNPMAFAGSIQCPLRLYAGEDTRAVNEPLVVLAKRAGKDCELVVVPGDHQAMVAPAVQKAIAWLRQQAAK
jgi:uncharacterized protein (TIGR03067 family)